MRELPRELEPTTSSDLARVIEPLASYICATDRPIAVLSSALALLMNEIDLIGKTATTHIATFSGDSRA